MQMRSTSVIRRLFIVLGAGTIVFAGLGALSYARQIGYVGSWQSIGLRRGILTFVTRVTPINDSTGLFVDGASVVNRAMYYINKGARWWQISIWPIVLCIVAGAGYTLVLLPIRHRRMRSQAVHRRSCRCMYRARVAVGNQHSH